VFVCPDEAFHPASTRPNTRIPGAPARRPPDIPPATAAAIAATVADKIFQKSKVDLHFVGILKKVVFKSTNGL
jgi:hypothetical protein